LRESGSGGEEGERGGTAQKGIQVGFGFGHLDVSILSQLRQ
jgi:hypothetical protein